MDKFTLDTVLVGVPEAVANMQLPDPDLRDYYRDEQDRIFWLDSEVGAATLDFIKMIIRCIVKIRVSQSKNVLLLSL